jgi:polynucleotide 5'-hydroxyl-kinase GRC3/NOL9
MVSLNIVEQPIFGPPFAHPQTPYHSFFIGSLSPKDDPKFYLECLKELIKKYRNEIVEPYLGASDATVPPLIINTQSWIHGMSLFCVLYLS